MAQFISSSGHDDIIHDAVLDYYGKKLATCSSDKTIKIFDIEGETHRLAETLKGHEGAVWCIAWAHPKFGSILGSSSFDGKIFIWREQNGQWQRVYDFTLHTASVNMVSWSPPEPGCHLGAASSDGSVSIITFNDNTFTHQIFPAHSQGANAISWSPALTPGQLTSAQAPGAQPPLVRRFVTGGSDNLVKLWEFNPQTQSYDNMCTLTGHTDWIRDVHWSLSPLSKSYIASASQDKTVRIWTCPWNADHSNPTNWTSNELEFGAVVWRVCWSMSGNCLAVSSGDSRVSLWKESLKDGWELVKTIEE